MWEKLLDKRWLLLVLKPDQTQSYALMTDKSGKHIGKIVEGLRVHGKETAELVKLVMGE